jgi:hypothetical protein
VFEPFTSAALEKCAQVTALGSASAAHQLMVNSSGPQFQSIA